MRPEILERKIARIIMALSRERGITCEQALDLFYATETYRQLTDPSFGLHLMSDEYILEDLRNNLRTMDFSH